MMQREEPDTVPIHQQVQTLIHNAIREGAAIEDLSLSFSADGYMQALRETVPGMTPWNNTGRQPATRYLNLPFCKNLPQLEPVTVVVSKPVTPATVPFQIAVPFEGSPIAILDLEAIGKKLTAGQLCDIVRAWLDADCQKWGEFEKRLDALILEHGTFE